VTPRGLTELIGLGFRIIKGLRSNTDAPQSAGLLWTSYQPVAENSVSQHTTLTWERPPRPRRDSNPQSQQVSGCRPVP